MSKEIIALGFTVDHQLPAKAVISAVLVRVDFFVKHHGAYIAEKFLNGDYVLTISPVKKRKST